MVMIVWEREGCWGDWLRQLAPELTLPLIEVRTPVDCWQAYVARPHEPVLIEFRPDRWLAGLELTHRLHSWRAGPQCLLGAVTSGSDAAAPALLEAGILDFATTPRDLLRLIERVRQYRQGPRRTGGR
jgi:hypothetical protein